MAKRKRSYGAYKKGSPEQKIKVELIAAIRSLRTGKGGCASARKHAEKASALLQGVPQRALFRQAMRIGRVGRIYVQKCGRL